MGSLVIELAEGHQWVVAVAVANIMIMTWMGITVGAARQKYGVAYPTMYADEKEHKHGLAFNCVQRAHQNTVEFSPAFLVSLLIGGLQYPLVTAAFGAAYGLARIQYFKGYSSGVANNRFSGGGFLFLPTYFGVVFCATAFALHQFFPNLL